MNHSEASGSEGGGTGARRRPPPHFRTQQRQISVDIAGAPAAARAALLSQEAMSALKGPIGEVVRMTMAAEEEAYQLDVEQLQARAETAEREREEISKELEEARTTLKEARDAIEQLQARVETAEREREELGTARETIKSLLAEVEAEKAKTKKEEVLERMRQAARFILNGVEPEESEAFDDAAATGEEDMKTEVEDNDN